ncbi:hypothetical protein MINTMi198_48500 [Mycobacterium intracellulare M.i.198]|uniref:Uncharacterized protein n=1 Tax=Mycobacterium intracellulare TaxID=1767 RepID=A0A7R7RPM6_MYCIT|nr:hypothetical protein MINTM005_48740 [Mycobacterium intracellulare]BCO70184.1 hypothetical protein MINTM007_47950 [Mycobacterium intracellulare]BCO96810.1 hypothetical protein MINTM016_47860 [Mycobacterium intracellulare]BCP02048.1 hypothetical protein MINTM018_48170 [Mycobacterium intracellulare]BCP39480.1 hypothetical protein MINTMi198_48500 [Mycobacterium intracellulare M.i.198]
MCGPAGSYQRARSVTCPNTIEAPHPSCMWVRSFVCEGRSTQPGLTEALVLDDHRVADVDVVVVPLGVIGAQADAAVADVLEPQ